MNQPIGERRIARCLMQVLWPAFLMAIVAEGVFFSMIDPDSLELFGVHVTASREIAYTVGFFVFWALFTASSGMTYLLTQNCPRASESTDSPPVGRQVSDERPSGR